MQLYRKPVPKAPEVKPEHNENQNSSGENKKFARFKTFYIVAVFKNMENAKKMQKKLQQEGMPSWEYSKREHLQGNR